MKKRSFERLLNTIPPIAHPKIEFEQYTSPVHLVSRLLWIAEFTYGDISGKDVLDLGAGTGRLGIGAALLGARQVILVDIDPDVLIVGLKSASRLGVRDVVDAVCCDVDSVYGLRTDTVVQNPPFGVHRRGADLRFLARAVEVAKVVYSIHKFSTLDYVRNFVLKMGLRCEVLFKEEVIIPHMYLFHSRERHRVEVVAIRVMR